MNVLFLFADQHNPSFSGCYGGITRTPNLDALAGEGILFEAAYTPCPMCSPARACLFTGQYVHENRCWDNCFPYNGDKLPGWGHYLRDQGVHLATIGKLDFAAHADNGTASEYEPDDRVSYDVVSLFRRPPLLQRPKYHMVNNWEVSPDGDRGHLEQNIVDEARRWFREEMPDRVPWILNVNFSKPHSPWHPDPAKYAFYREQICLSPKYLQCEQDLHEVDRQQSRHTCGYVLDGEHVKDCHAAYHAIVEEHDENIGAVIEALKETGQYENTLIIYAADHGEMLRAHGAWEKSSMYEDSIRVPMIIRVPGAAPGRVRIPVSLLDIFPTIRDFLGCKKPNGNIHGDSLLPVIHGKGDLSGRAVFSESHANGRITGTFAVRKGQWKLIHYDGYGSLLYDLKDDPEEMRDLGESKDPVALRAKQELMEILESVCHPGEVTKEAFADQEKLKKELYLSGQLERELQKRGFSYDGENLYYLP